jgi:hypothetical protein
MTSCMRDHIIRYFSQDAEGPHQPVLQEETILRHRAGDPAWVSEQFRIL